MKDIKEMIAEMEGRPFMYVPVNPLLKPIQVAQVGLYLLMFQRQS